MRALLVVVIAMVGMLARAHAEPFVALLPLDADPKLEIYGQPVASEVARTLKGANIDIQVVGAKMAVPDQATLIVDGTIKAGKGTQIVMSLRIRNPVDGVVLSTVSVTAPSIATIDKAAADVSARLLPILHDKLASATKPAQPEPTVVRDAPTPSVAKPPELRPLLVSISMHAAESEPLRAALTTELDAQVRKVLRTPQLADPAKMTKSLATKTVRDASLDLGIALDVHAYWVEPGVVPIAHARVRMLVTDAVGIVFDRIIVTDSVVGEKGLDIVALSGRVAREVLDIARPHLKKKVAAWR